MSVYAQTSSQGEDAKTIELRQKIGIDYSMPDFDTSSINGKVIGTRLAKMLQKLQDSALDYIWSGRIIALCCDKIDGLQYAPLEKFKIKRISKSGDVITVKANARLGKNAVGVKNTDIQMVFDKGVSDSQTINEMFSDLSRYVKELQPYCCEAAYIKNRYEEGGEIDITLIRQRFNMVSFLSFIKS